MYHHYSPRFQRISVKCDILFQSQRDEKHTLPKLLDVTLTCFYLRLTLHLLPGTTHPLLLHCWSSDKCPLQAGRTKLKNGRFIQLRVRVRVPPPQDLVHGLQEDQCDKTPPADFSIKTNKLINERINKQITVLKIIWDRDWWPTSRLQYLFDLFVKKTQSILPRKSASEIIAESKSTHL